MMQIDGLVDSLRSYLDSPEDNSMDIGLSRPSLISLTSSLQLTSWALAQNPNFTVFLYSQNIISDIREILRVSSIALTPMDKVSFLPKDVHKLNMFLSRKAVK